MQVTILGCGSSGGVPLITGDWGKCNPEKTKNRRRRSSVLVQINDKKILIDASPDLREQLLDVKEVNLDAVLITHAHFDHICGLPELRIVSLKNKATIPVFADQQTLVKLIQTFGYAFLPLAEGYPPFLQAQEIKPGSFNFKGIDITCFEQNHGLDNISLGVRIGGFAYSTDVKNLSEHAFFALQGVECWIIDCLRREPHPTHLHLEETLKFIRRVNPKRAILTHMTEHLDYDELLEELPDNIIPAYDGMVINL